VRCLVNSSGALGYFSNLMGPPFLSQVQFHVESLENKVSSLQITGCDVG